MGWVFFSQRLWNLYDNGSDSLMCPKCKHDRPALKFRKAGKERSGKQEIELQCGAGHVWRETKNFAKRR